MADGKHDLSNMDICRTTIEKSDNDGYVVCHYFESDDGNEKGAAYYPDDEEKYVFKDKGAMLKHLEDAY